MSIGQLFEEGWCPLPWPRRAASAAMLEVAAGGGYRVSPCIYDAGYVSVALSMRPSRKRTAPGLRRAPCSVLSGLSSPILSDRTRAAVLPPGRQSIQPIISVEASHE